MFTSPGTAAPSGTTPWHAAVVRQSPLRSLTMSSSTQSGQTIEVRGQTIYIEVSGTTAVAKNLRLRRSSGHMRTNRTKGTNESMHDFKERLGEEIDDA